MVILNQTTPVARKEHTCDFCGGIIPIGEKYKRNTIIDGYLYDFVCHCDCEEIVDELKMYGEWGEAIGGDDFISEINDYVYDHHYDKESCSIEKDWQLQPHDLVKKILEELKNK